MDQNFHDVTIVDMDEEREPKVTAGDLTHLRDSWPPRIFNHIKCFQRDLELMRKEAKQEFTQSRPMPCKYCGKVIRCNMYRHVARLHLDLAQLWRCPVSCCTVWRGSPQDCMEHLRNGHDVSWISKTASIERFAPPWTVYREVWTESMRLEHHHRVYRGGLPYAAFRSDYMTRPSGLLDNATKYDGGTSVAIGNRTRGNIQICKAVALAFPTGACDVGGGWRTTVTNRSESARHGWSKCDRLPNTGATGFNTVECIEPRNSRECEGGPVGSISLAEKDSP